MFLVLNILIEIEHCFGSICRGAFGSIRGGYHDHGGSGYGGRRSQSNAVSVVTDMFLTAGSRLLTFCINYRRIGQPHRSWKGRRPGIWTRIHQSSNHFPPPNQLLNSRGWEQYYYHEYGNDPGAIFHPPQVTERRKHKLIRC